MLNTRKVFVAIALSLPAALAFQQVMQGEEALSKAGISVEDARKSVKYSLEEGYLSFPRPNGLKEVPVAERAAVVRGIGAFAKAYVATAEFAAGFRPHFAVDRETEPQPPQKPEQTGGLQQQMLQSLQQTYELYKEQAAKMTDPEMKKQFEDMATQTKAEIEEMKAAEKNMTAEERANQAAMDRQMNGAAQQQYDKQMAEYKKQHAAWEARKKQAADRTPKGVAKARLQQFLEATNGVDYNAQLVTRNGKRYFVNAAYEAKPAQWKMAFRAGKEATEAARQFAREWLAELNAGK